MSMTLSISSSMGSNWQPRTNWAGNARRASERHAEVEKTPREESSTASDRDPSTDAIRVEASAESAAQGAVAKREFVDSQTLVDQAADSEIKEAVQRSRAQTAYQRTGPEKLEPSESRARAGAETPDELAESARKKSLVDAENAVRSGTSRQYNDMAVLAARVLA